MTYSTTLLQPADRETPPQAPRGAPAHREPDRRMRWRRIRAWTMSALRDVVYAGAVFVWSIAAFTILVTGVSVTASLLVLFIGVFVWVGFTYVLRWTTSVDRHLAGWQRHEHLPAAPRRSPGRGFVPLLKTVSSDPQTWRDLAWLALTSIVGFTWGLAVITAAGIVTAYLSMPAWYWAISDPQVHYGLTNVGLVTVNTLGEAFAMTAIGLVVTPVALLFAHWFARTHAGWVATMLSAPATPTRASARASHELQSNDRTATVEPSGIGAIVAAGGKHEPSYHSQQSSARRWV